MPCKGPWATASDAQHRAEVVCGHCKERCCAEYVYIHIYPYHPCPCQVCNFYRNTGLTHATAPLCAPGCLCDVQTRPSGTPTLPSHPPPTMAPTARSMGSLPHTPSLGSKPITRILAGVANSVMRGQPSWQIPLGTPQALLALHAAAVCMVYIVWYMYSHTRHRRWCILKGWQWMPPI